MTWGYSWVPIREISKEATKAPLDSGAATPPQPEEIKTTTVVLSYTSLASLHLSIKGARVSLVSATEGKETTHAHLHGELPAEAAPSYGETG